MDKIEQFLRQVFETKEKYIKENQPYDALTTRAFYRAKGERDLAKQILQMIEDEKAPKDETKYFGPLLKDRMFFKCQNKDCAAYDENKENNCCGFFDIKNCSRSICKGE